jgi:hypothetical protein
MKSLKTLKKKWPKAKIRRGQLENNNNYPDALKEEILKYLGDYSQAEIGKILGIKPGYISRWSLLKKKKKKTKKKATKKKKVEVKKEEKEEKETFIQVSESYFRKCEKSRDELVELQNDMKEMAHTILRIDLCEYLEETADELRRNRETRRLGSYLLAVAHQFDAITSYLQKGNKKHFTMAMKKLK